MRQSAGRAGGPILSVAVLAGVGALIWRLPAVLSTTWAAIVLVLRDVSPVLLFLLSAVWLAGLLAHTLVQTAALPGLSVRRALLLNLTGSAVSDLMPFGGAAGVGLGYLMTRRWQIDLDRFTVYTAISNLWNVVSKGVVGVGLLGGAVALGVTVPARVQGLLVPGAVAVLVVVGTVALTLMHPRVAAVFGAERLRAATASVIVAGWAQLTLGVLVYLLLQALLLGMCLAAVGAQLPWTVVVVAFAVERILTLIPITPGGAGFAELGAVAALSALHAEPVTAAAGVLLFRLFTFFLEIPVGAFCALVWLRLTRLEARA